MKKYADPFKSFEEFADCVRRGCEIEFEYEDQRYFVAPGNAIYIYRITDEESLVDMFAYNDPYASGTYMIGGNLLSNIIIELNVVDRSF